MKKNIVENIDFSFIIYSIAPSVFILLHHASVKVASVLMLFVIFGGDLVCWSIGRPNGLPFATVVACPVTLHSTLLHRGYSGTNWRELTVISGLLSIVIIYFQSLSLPY